MLVLASTFLQWELYQESLIVFLPWLSHSHQRTDANSSTMTPGCYLGLQNAHPSFRELATNDLSCLRENSKNSVIYFIYIFVEFYIKLSFGSSFKKILNGLLKFLQRKGMCGECGEDEQRKQNRDWGKGRERDSRRVVIENTSDKKGKGEQKNRTGLCTSGL